MAWIIVVFGLLALVIFYVVNQRKQRERKTTEKIRSSWGNPKKEPLSFDRIGRFAEVMVRKDGFHQLSTQTMEDIDFYDLFSFLDRTSSSVGQQFLFHKLVRPVGSIGPLLQFNKRVNHLGSHQEVREEIQTELSRLSSPGAYSISSLLEDKIFGRPKWLKFLPLSLVVVVVFFLVGLKYPIFFILMIVPLSANVIIHYWHREMVFERSRSFPQLNLLIDVAHNISSGEKHVSTAEVAESLTELKPLQWKLGMLAFANDGAVRDEISQAGIYLVELLKGLLLIEVFMSLQILRQLELKRHLILTLFNYVGEIDAAISVASVRAGRLMTCIPEFSAASKELGAKGVYHPLLGNSVENDLWIGSKGVLITGSNMSGKSTFLRTLIINSILAQTIFTCFAREFRTPFLRQFSSIRLDDSLQKGTSYFFEEVKLMGNLVTESRAGIQSIFFLDEVFKGTNTVERVAAAKAILSYLNRDNNIVVVSTHDIELASMLESEYDLFHFEETFHEGELHFDHKLKPGRMKGGNAIKILALAAFPEEIIREASLLTGAIRVEGEKS